MGPDASTAIERSEDLQPKRLRRTDVAMLRDLYAQAYACQHEGWTAKRTIWFPREAARIAAGKLGRPTPGVVVDAKWTKRHVLGLDVVITAYERIGRPGVYLKVAEHRFRAGTKRTQFCREIAHAARQGLGWCGYRQQMLVNVLGAD
jgi:hypothetical protein